MEDPRLIKLLVFALTLCAQLLVGAAQDHPVIAPIPGFTLADREFEEFSAYEFSVVEGDQETKKSVEGKYWFLSIWYSCIRTIFDSSK